MRTPDSENATRLTLIEHRILTTIREQGEAYGLQLVRLVGVKRGTVYAVLDRLRFRGFVDSRVVPLPEGEVGPSRMAYRVTETGERALKAWAAAEAVWSD